jgi:hypothetical protein
MSNLTDQVELLPSIDVFASDESFQYGSSQDPRISKTVLPAPDAVFDDSSDHLIGDPARLNDLIHFLNVC